MKVWGIDPSSNCGLAIWQSERDISSAHCEVIEKKGKRDYYWYSLQLGRKINARVKEFGKPDLVVIEQGSESSQGTGVDGLIWLWDCISAYTAVFGCFGVPITTITPGRWRKPFYGENFDAPKLPVLETVFVNGQKVRRQVLEGGLPKYQNDWKTAAVTKCTELGVVIPEKKTVAHNACEAIGIAHSWAHSSVINAEFLPAFTAMLKARNDKAAAAGLPLFGAAA